MEVVSAWGRCLHGSDVTVLRKFPTFLGKLGNRIKDN